MSESDHSQPQSLKSRESRLAADIHREQVERLAATHREQIKRMVTQSFGSWNKATGLIDDFSRLVGEIMLRHEKNQKDRDKTWVQMLDKERDRTWYANPENRLLGFD